MAGRLRDKSAEKDPRADNLAKVSDFRRTYAEQELKAAILPPNIADARRTANAVDRPVGWFSRATQFVGGGIAAVATGAIVVSIVGAAAVGGFFAGAIGDIASGGATGGSIAVLGAVAATGVAIANRHKIANFVSNRLGTYPAKHVDKVCGHVASKVQEILKQKYLDHAKELDTHGVNGQAHKDAMDRYMSALKDAGQEYMQAYYEQNVQGVKNNKLRYLQAPNDLDFKADLKEFIEEAQEKQNHGKGSGVYNQRTADSVRAGSPVADLNQQYGLPWTPEAVKGKYTQLLAEQRAQQEQAKGTGGNGIAQG